MNNVSMLNAFIHGAKEMNTLLVSHNLTKVNKERIQGFQLALEEVSVFIKGCKDIMDVLVYVNDKLIKLTEEEESSFVLGETLGYTTMRNYITEALLGK